MLSVFDKIFDHIQHGPQRKKVEQYLHNATPGQSEEWTMIHCVGETDNDSLEDSLLDHLRKALSPSLSAINGLRTTFNTFSFHDPSQEDYCQLKTSNR